LKLVQAVPPTVMPEAPVKLVPVIVIVSPPAVLPDVGEMEVTVGDGVIVITIVSDVPPLVRV
jgi:hypothetical protein